MKKSLVLLLFSIGFIVCGTTVLQGQADSMEDLGNQFAKTLMQNDKETYQTLFFDKETFLEILKANAPEQIDPEQKKAMLEEMNTNFESQILSMYNNNFVMLQKKVEFAKIKLEGLKYEIIPNPNNQDKHTKVIHSKIDDPLFKHFYFFATEYEGKWYLSAPVSQITEEEIKL